MKELKELIIDALKMAINDKKEYNDEVIAFQCPEKCKYCDYYFDFLCRVDKCAKDERR